MKRTYLFYPLFVILCLSLSLPVSGSVREKYNINLIGLKHGDKMNMNVAPDEVFPADCTVVAAGANSDLNKVSEN